MPSDSSDRRAARPPQITATDHQEQPPLPCPRCESTHTKFCYYNNYNLSQPRHFCKSCRRYWTQGGALRNIPVGGGTRSKAHHPNKRSRTTTAETSASASPTPSISAPPAPSHVPVSEPDISSPLLSADLGVSGTFSSLLATPSTGFLALGDPFLNRPGFGLGLGLDGIGLGLGRGVWPAGDVGENGGNTWQMGISEGLVDGDCFSWPDLAISTPGMGLQ